MNKLFLKEILLFIQLLKIRAEKIVLYLILNGSDKSIKNKKGMTALESIQNEKIADKKWLEKLKKILDGKIKNYTELDSYNFDTLLKNEENIKFEEKIDIVNGIIKNIYKDRKLKNKNDLSKLSIEISTNFKLRELFKNFSDNVKYINIDDMIKNIDKNNTGTMQDSDFDILLNSIKSQNMNSDDLSFLKSFLDKDKNKCIRYKEFISLIKD